MRLSLFGQHVSRGYAQDVAVDFDAKPVGFEHRVESNVPRDILDIYRHRNSLDRSVDHEVHAILFGDVVQDVADVGINDIQIYRLAYETRLSVLAALIDLTIA